MVYPECEEVRRYKINENRSRCLQRRMESQIDVSDFSIFSHHISDFITRLQQSYHKGTEGTKLTSLIKETSNSITLFLLDQIE